MNVRSFYLLPRPPSAALSWTSGLAPALRIPLQPLCSFPFASWTATHPTIPGSRPPPSLGDVSSYPSILLALPLGCHAPSPLSFLTRLLALSSHFGSLSIRLPPKHSLSLVLVTSSPFTFRALCFIRRCISPGALHHLAFVLHSSFGIHHSASPFAFSLRRRSSPFVHRSPFRVRPFALRQASCVHPSPCAFS